MGHTLKMLQISMEGSALSPTKWRSKVCFSAGFECNQMIFDDLDSILILLWRKIHHR